MTREELLQRVRHPASAAVAGIIFAVILIAVILLLRSVQPSSLAEADQWTSADRRDEVNLALSLIPFAGIAFLWFIGVIRAQLGSLEDRFFETVFLGSGLLFVAMLFASGASLTAVLVLEDGGYPLTADERALSWGLAAALLSQFGARMAAVFAMSVATVGRRMGTLPRWLALFGYLTGILLLLTPPFPPPVQLMFPVWVLGISLVILFRRHRRQSAPSSA